MAIIDDEMSLMGLPDAQQPLLDLRERAPFVAGHVAPASHLPFSDLILRRHELPPPGTALQLLAADHDTLQAAVQQLRSWQYPIAGEFLLDERLQKNAEMAARWQTGSQSKQLWQPSLTLALALQLPAVLAARATVGTSALDLACGSGREALYLARQGYAVTAVDIKPDALERLAASAAAAELTVQAHCLDLELSPPDWPAASFGLIHVARYLHRPLFPYLQHWLKPGGVLIYETFLRGAEQFGGPRRPQFLLERGELVERFAGWTVLHAAEQTLADGRPVQQFVGQKPVASVFGKLPQGSGPDQGPAGAGRR